MKSTTLKDQVMQLINAEYTLILLKPDLIFTMDFKSLELIIANIDKYSVKLDLFYELFRKTELFKKFNISNEYMQGKHLLFKLNNKYDIRLNLETKQFVTSLNTISTTKKEIEKLKSNINDYEEEIEIGFERLKSLNKKENERLFNRELANINFCIISKRADIKLIKRKEEEMKQISSCNDLRNISNYLIKLGYSNYCTRNIKRGASKKFLYE